MVQSGVLSTTHLIVQYVTFLRAGQETTASALGWATYKVSLYLKIPQKFREEIRANFPSPSSGAAMTAEEINNLSCLNVLY